MILSNRVKRQLNMSFKYPNLDRHPAGHRVEGAASRRGLHVQGAVAYG